MANDSSGRRAGDWTHKAQRSREQANAIVKEPGGKRWYEDNFWIIFLLVVFWPVGLVLMWRSGWPVAAKVVVSIVIVALAVVSFSLWSAVQASMGA
ncbi:MAG: holotricin-3 [Eggerthellaceae bacterium]|jgi:hypothetical protein|nr:holotricin-3 [Eggerthellaceae bacterium]